ncbi:unnamed protein product, partial [Pneumocystis jirovecii]
MVDKLGGTYAPRPSPGPHKLRDCLPLIIFLRNRLKYALNNRETIAILMQRLVKVDGKVRTDHTYPAGFMDVISIERTGENFRLVYDTKGRYMIHRITSMEATYKLCKIKKVQLGPKAIPYAVTHDGRTIVCIDQMLLIFLISFLQRYPNPDIHANDTVKFDLVSNKIDGHIPFEVGKLAMVTGGRSKGRVGLIIDREHHNGGFDIVHIKDSLDHTFATRLSNVFVIGDISGPWISLPKGKGLKLTISEERDRRRNLQNA